MSTLLGTPRPPLCIIVVSIESNLLKNLENSFSNIYTKNYLHMNRRQADNKLRAGLFLSVTIKFAT